MSLQGAYEHEEGDIDTVPIQITHGYSRDHRPDLKQFVISLVMSDSLPVFIQALSGNTSDKNHFREIVKEYGRSLQAKWGKPQLAAEICTKTRYGSGTVRDIRRRIYERFLRATSG